MNLISFVFSNPETQRIIPEQLEDFCDRSRHDRKMRVSLTLLLQLTANTIKVGDSSNSKRFPELNVNVSVKSNGYDSLQEVK